MIEDADAMLDLIHESIVVRDMDGRILAWNAASETLYGRPRDTVKGHHFRELACIEEDPVIEAAQTTLIETGYWEGELQRNTADGRQLVVDVRWSLRHDEAGNPSSVFETGRDVTARKAAEERLRYSEHRYRNLFQAMAASFWEIDFSGVDTVLRTLHRSGVTDFATHFAAHPETVKAMMRAARVIDVNDETVSLFGEGDKQALLRDLEPFWPEGSETVFSDGILAGIARKPNYSAETRLRTISGRVFDALFTASYPPETMGKGTLVIGVIDISERKRAEAELRRSERNFAHASRVAILGELTASIAHEVNQPLAAIATNGEAGLRWLARAEPDIEEVRRLATRIVADARRAADIIARIRGMATNRNPEHAPVTINAIINDATLLLHHELLTQSVDLELALDAADPVVMADRVQLQQVVVNLAVNAIQAMAGRSGAVLRLQSRTGQGYVHMTVADNGPGIPEGDPGRLFDSFFTTKPGGMGIGLAICRTIIEAHGGRIDAANGNGGGAIFNVALPEAGPVHTKI